MSALKGKNYGFTLIELLVVISIVSLLSSIVLAETNETRSKSRDSYRIQTLKQIQNALLLYELNNGSLPVPANDPGNVQSPDFSHINSIDQAAEWDTFLQNEISVMPHDPNEGEVVPGATANTAPPWYQMFHTYKFMYVYRQSTISFGGNTADVIRPTLYAGLENISGTPPICNGHLQGPYGAINCRNLTIGCVTGDAFGFQAITGTHPWICIHLGRD